ncbi:hypothetical protein tpqmel_0044 [Candidatus Gastranaerophilus sp. (ex Termes propinquus)]|nr:hypothetical protein tpqmel_0044 [Candidatus Gastranaerophilus sp. (ex Termes propinquus)]
MRKVSDSVLIAQLNPVPGDILGNFEAAKECILEANDLSASALIFPELFLFGYPAMDMIDRYPWLVDKNIEYLEELAALTCETAVLIGFVEVSHCRFGRKYFNSIAILQNGKIHATVQKSLLCEYSQFHEARYFQPGSFVPEDRIIKIGKHRAGLLICEEQWADEDFFENQIYGFDPLKALIEEGRPDFIINCSASPTRAKKEQLRHNLLSYLCKKYNTPLIFANQVGANDALSFMGASCAYDSEGEIVARAQSFESELFPVNLSFKACDNTINPLPTGLEADFNSEKCFTLDYEPDLDRTHKVILHSVRDYFKKTGFKRAVLGLSGGLDSAVCAVLLAQALGAENILALSMPTDITTFESKRDAKILAENLGIHFMEVPIKPMVAELSDAIFGISQKTQGFWTDRYAETYTQDNIQARARATVLWGISNEFPCTLPIVTSDKSELYVGYSTVNGDMSGGFAPISDVVKTKVFALAHWLNKHYDSPIPEDILNKRPSAELAIDPQTGKPLLAEEALMPYEFLDEAIFRLENFGQDTESQMAEKFLYEEKNTLEPWQKRMWLEKFFKRAQSALFKWSIMPTGPIIDAHSINKQEFTQPVVSKII